LNETKVIEPLTSTTTTNKLFLQQERIETPSLPVLSRTLYLILVENQAELEEFTHHFPSLTSDVVFDCWNEICRDPHTRKGMDPMPDVWSSAWHSHATHTITNRMGRTEQFDRFHDPLFSMMPDTHLWRTKPSLYIINELELNLTEKQSLTQSRNRLYDFIHAQEEIQGWKWSYLTIMDGDAHITCDRVLKEERSDEAWYLQYKRFQELDKPNASFRDEENLCWLAFTAFLLTTAPAMAAPQLHDPKLSWYGSVAYHIDGVIGAIHHEAIDLLYPICERFDSHTWWSSQAGLIYESICLYSHVFTWNHITVHSRKGYKNDNRPYPRHTAPFAPFDQYVNELNLYPKRLQGLHEELGTGTFHLQRIESFSYYTGFDRQLHVRPDCQLIRINRQTCVKVPVSSAPATMLLPNAEGIRIRPYFKLDFIVPLCIDPKCGCRFDYQNAGIPGIIDMALGKMEAFPGVPMTLLSTALQLHDIVPKLPSPKGDGSFVVNLGAAEGRGGYSDPTWNLLTYSNLSGLLIDGQTDSRLFDAYPIRSNIQILPGTDISPSTIVSLFNKYKVPFPEFAVLKIDIDSNDLLVVTTILDEGAYSPLVIQMEFNPIFVPPMKFSIPSSVNINDYAPPVWLNENAFYGSSLASIYDQLSPRGYFLLNVDGWDSIWIRHDIRHLFTLPESVKSAFESGFSAKIEQTPQCRPLRLKKIFDPELESSDNITMLLQKYAPKHKTDNSFMPFEFQM